MTRHTLITDYGDHSVENWFSTIDEFNHGLGGGAKLTPIQYTSIEKDAVFISRKENLPIINHGEFIYYSHAALGPSFKNQKLGLEKL